jgi:hypothetical protein
MKLITHLHRAYEVLHTITVYGKLLKQWNICNSMANSERCQYDFIVPTEWLVVDTELERMLKEVVVA